MSADSNDQRPDNQQANTIAYLQRSLQLNPLYASEKIIRYRSKALGLKKSKSLAASIKDPAQRTRLLQKIEAIRAVCWTEPVEPLLARLKQLDLKEHPDLLRSAKRLRIILMNRVRLPELAQHKHFDEKFMFCFKQILTLPPSELAVRREQVVATFRNPKKRRKGMKMVKLLEATVPELCQLEQEWLDSLKRQKAKRTFIVQEDYSQVGSKKSKNLDGWVIWVVLFIGLAAIKAIFRNP